MIKIGIVILNYKTYKDTIRLAKDIVSFKMKDEIQIIIVDNLSPNESYNILNKELKGFNNIKVIQSGENGGYAKGNNVGLRALKKYNPKYALIVNNDVYFSEETLKKCVNIYEGLPDVGLLSPLQMLPNRKIASLGDLKCNNFIRDLLSHLWIYNKIIPKKSNYTSNTPFKNLRKVDIIPGCFVFINYMLFESIGFYDEDTFLFCEERFLFKKLSTKGYSNYLILDDAYIHDHSLTIKSEVDIMRQRKYYNDGQIVYTKKYRNFPSLLSLLLKFTFIYSCLELKLSGIIKRFIK